MDASLPASQTENLSLRSRLLTCQDYAHLPDMADLILPVVFEGLFSTDSSDRIAALRTLRLLGKDAEPLLPTMEQFLHDGNYLVQLAAMLLVSSGAIGYPETIICERLEPLLNASTRLVRSAAAEILAAHRR